MGKKKKKKDKKKKSKGRITVKTEYGVPTIAQAMEAMRSSMLTALGVEPDDYGVLNEEVLEESG